MGFWSVNPGWSANPIWAAPLIWAEPIWAGPLIWADWLASAPIWADLPPLARRTYANPAQGVWALDPNYPHCWLCKITLHHLYKRWALKAILEDLKKPKRQSRFMEFFGSVRF